MYMKFKRWESAANFFSGYFFGENEVKLREQQAQWERFAILRQPFLFSAAQSLYEFSNYILSGIPFDLLHFQKVAFVDQTWRQICVCRWNRNWYVKLQFLFLSCLSLCKKWQSAEITSRIVKISLINNKIGQLILILVNISSSWDSLFNKVHGRNLPAGQQLRRVFECFKCTELCQFGLLVLISI